MSEPWKMRDRQGVQRAHDYLHAIVAGEVRLDVSNRELVMLHAVHDAISWVMQEPCGECFQENLDQLIRTVHAAGYVERKHQ
jgi:hypothetical protein